MKQKVAEGRGRVRQLAGKAAGKAQDKVPAARDTITDTVFPTVRDTITERVIPTVRDTVIPTVRDRMTGQVIPAVSSAVETARESEAAAELRRRAAGVAAAAAGREPKARSRWPFAVGAFAAGALAGAALAIAVRRPTPLPDPYESASYDTPEDATSSSPASTLDLPPS